MHGKLSEELSSQRSSKALTCTLLMFSTCYPIIQLSKSLLPGVWLFPEVGEAVVDWVYRNSLLL